MDKLSTAQLIDKYFPAGIKLSGIQRAFGLFPRLSERPDAAQVVFDQYEMLAKRYRDMPPNILFICPARSDYAKKLNLYDQQLPTAIAKLFMQQKIQMDIYCAVPKNKDLINTAILFNKQLKPILSPSSAVMLPLSRNTFNQKG